MESTRYSLTEQVPTAESTDSESGYRYADPEQIRESIPVPFERKLIPRPPVRSHQRDTEHVERLRELVTDVSRNIRGERSRVVWKG